MQLSVDPGDVPLRVAYADPPYPGTSSKYYRHHPDYAGEVDHRALLVSLTNRAGQSTTSYDGWALSTSRRALYYCLHELRQIDSSLDVIHCPWVKTHHQPFAGGPGSIHEYVIVCPARKRRPGPPDALYTSVARGGDSDLTGRKPLKFIHWMFALVGLSPVDAFDDLFPGSGIVGRCFREWGRSTGTCPTRDRSNAGHPIAKKQGG